MNKLLKSFIIMSRTKKATHAAVTRSLETLLPLKENDVQRLYHLPRNPRYDAETAAVEQIVLSVTPTPGVYSLIGYPLDKTTIGSTAPSPQIHARPPWTLCFLHRPFTLDRRSVRKGALVLSSHTSFDELLTVGWNTALAGRLGITVGESLCVQGYKGDTERRIGIIGQVSILRATLEDRIQEEFGASELAHEGLSSEIRVIAIMNAFNEQVVHRVLEMAQQRGWVGPDEGGRHVLYLTGQPRIGGMEAARAAGVSVACVGHRQAEDWGIRYMAEELRRAFPGAHVEEVLEEEIPVTIMHALSLFQSPRVAPNLPTPGRALGSAKRKVSSSEQPLPTAPPPKRKAGAIPCPHSMTIVRSTRQFAADKESCPICLEDYFSTPDDRDKVAPVNMACLHVFCRECIETHLSSSMRCPLPWCDAQLPLQPHKCELCAAWEKDHAAAGSLVVTVRANEMFGTIKDALARLSQGDDFYVLSKTAKDRLLAHVHTTLKRYEWHFHSGIDLAELLDPFLLAINAEDTLEHYGPELSAPVPAKYVSHFPPREHDPNDYGPGEEPWIAA
ncbi:hypothetical protein EJ02DRAFT_509786 [Clathrospora elynae]|uniref:RING-type domain-containing protein n=1 Tax=Clathrospora elynae TaxID=706981 RepID=A0A6A5SX80_9PLEO|nr:hypothetical protein EJ02DRAFT_509786 [Clathrospora elynae]